MNTKYQVFVSSTYEDLKEHRDQAVKTILRMGHLPVGMEMFNAADSTQWEIIKRHIDNSDYYVVILAHRYGSIDPEDGISYTEKEYNYALEQEVPCLGFVIDSSVSWAPGLMAKGKDLTKLEAFKAKIKSRMVSFWTSSDNLALHISSALSEAFTTRPRIGWIRANEMTTSPVVAEEMARLSKRNEELTAQLSAQHTNQDELDEVLLVLNNLHYQLIVQGKPVEKTLLEIFLALFQVEHSIYPESILEVLFKEEVDEDESNIGPAIKELAFLKLISTAKSYDFTITEKGSKIYTRVRRNLYRE